MLSAAVIVCTATGERTGLLRETVDSVLAGSRLPDELLVVVDTDAELAARLQAILPPRVRLLVSPRQGLSQARNTGIAAARSDVVAFLDDDAVAEPQWLSSLVESFERDRALLGAGGPIVPRWGAARRWVSDELLWVVGCTYAGHRADAGPIRNPIGCNMAFRRRELVDVGSFAHAFGKRGNALATCEETELALRLQRSYGPGRISYVPAATVRHYVPPARISWRLLVRRSISEGLAKGRLQRIYAGGALGTERAYVRRLVTHNVPRLFLEGLRRRDAHRVLGAIAILSSLIITALAFVAGNVRELRERTQLAAAQPVPGGKG